MVGFLLGGIIVHHGGNSRTVFWVTAAFSVVVFAVAYFLVPEIGTRTRNPIDFVGVLLVAAGTFAVALAISEGSARCSRRPRCSARTEP